MDENVQKIVVLLAFALVCVFLNIKANETWMKLVTVVGSFGALGLAGYLIVDWVLV